MHSEKNLEISWKMCICFVCQSYYRTRRLGVVRGSDFLEKIHQICWFSGCDFHLPIKKSSADFAFWKKILGNFEDFVIFLSFHLADWNSSQKAMVFWKISIRFAGFLAVISTSKRKIFRNLCIQKKAWRFSENSASFLCSKATIEHAASGWCAAGIFWKRSKRFAGFLVVIFTSQWKIFSNLCILNKLWRFLCGLRRNDE